MDVQGVSLSTSTCMAVKVVSISTVSTMDVQGVSLSIASIMDVNGVSPCQTEGENLVWFREIRKKISQIINDYLYLPFFLLIILW